MRKLPALLIALIVLFAFSCKTEVPAPNEKVPDLIVNLDVKENGTSIAQLNFNYTEQNGGASATSAANGSYVDLANLFSFQVVGELGKVGPTLGVTAKMNTLGKENLQLGPIDSNDPFANPYATFNSADGVSFTTTSGNVNITKMDLFQSLIQETYFANMSMDAILQNADGSRTITITGSLEGITIGSQ